MILKRTMDATFLNGVANHADVRPSLGGVGALDLSQTIADPKNVTLQGEYGGFVGVRLEPGVYECHSMFLREGRGGYALDAMREGLRYLFTRTDCIEVVTKAPEGNLAALGAARGMGFVVSFRLDKGWPLGDGQFGPVDCMSLPFKKWVAKDDAVQERGEWFHNRLEELTTAQGKAIPVHYEELAHNRAAGASVLMFEAGNPVKATASYNLWAKTAGFPTMRLLSLNPVILDMDQVVIGISDGDMEVLRCQSGS